MSPEHEPIAKRRITKDRREAFLRDVRAHGIIREAARVASPGSKHARGAEQSFRDLMARDAEFAAQVEEARREADAALEREIHRRGVSGFEEERVDSRGRVSVVRRYSDACILAMARARLPGYAKSDVAISGALKHEHDDAASRAIADAVRKLAEQMASEALPNVTAMLEADL